MSKIKSVYNSDVDILRAILDLHMPGDNIDLDPTYSKGVFYKNAPDLMPTLKSDLFPVSDDVVEADFCDLHFVESGGLDSVVFDPPFVISGRTYKDSGAESCQTAQRFGTYHSWNEIKTSYKAALSELHRVLRDDGILAFKCQDVVGSGKNHMTHVFVMNEAVSLGFYPKDLFIKLATSKMTSFGGRWKTQQHAMKHHSYWWVFEKRRNGSKVDYDLKQGI